MIDRRPARERAGPWIEFAACRDVDPTVFFVDRGESVAEARAICNACPVRLNCLDHALTNSERHGIWGGLTEAERRKVKRERQRLNARRATS